MVRYVKQATEAMKVPVSDGLQDLNAKQRRLIAPQVADGYALSV